MPRVLGFIGLGVMGYPMALNVLKKLEDGVKLQVYDASPDVLKKIAQEARGKISVCANARVVTENSVCRIAFLYV
jgi:3-hydroxyisobutyrate dehydrogenase